MIKSIRLYFRKVSKHDFKKCKQIHDDGYVHGYADAQCFARFKKSDTFLINY